MVQDLPVRFGAKHPGAYQHDRNLQEPTRRLVAQGAVRVDTPKESYVVIHRCCLLFVFLLL